MTEYTAAADVVLNFALNINISRCQHICPYNLFYCSFNFNVKYRVLYVLDFGTLKTWIYELNTGSLFSNSVELPIPRCGSNHIQIQKCKIIYKGNITFSLLFVIKNNNGFLTETTNNGWLHELDQVMFCFKTSGMKLTPPLWHNLKDISLVWLKQLIWYKQNYRIKP